MRLGPALASTVVLALTAGAGVAQAAPSAAFDLRASRPCVAGECRAQLTYGLGGLVNAVTRRGRLGHAQLAGRLPGRRPARLRPAAARGPRLPGPVRDEGPVPALVRAPPVRPTDGRSRRDDPNRAPSVPPAGPRRRARPHAAQHRPMPARASRRDQALGPSRRCRVLPGPDRTALGRADSPLRRAWGARYRCARQADPTGFYRRDGWKASRARASSVPAPTTANSPLPPSSVATRPPRRRVGPSSDCQRRFRLARVRTGAVARLPVLALGAARLVSGGT